MALDGDLKFGFPKIYYSNADCPKMSPAKPHLKYHRRRMAKQRGGSILLQELLVAGKAAAQFGKPVDGALRDVTGKTEDLKQQRILKVCDEIAQKFMKRGDRPS